MDARLRKALTGHRLIGVDTCVLIYHLEDHPRFGRSAGDVLKWLQDGRAEGVLSTLALMEVQVGAYRSEDEELGDYYYAMLQALPHARWEPLTYEIADRAAAIRASSKISVPDAIHLATAVSAGATAFITNDRSLPPLPELDIVQLIN